MINLTDSIIKNCRRLYRHSCKTCGADRGYQRKREANKNCKSCENVVKFSGKKHSEETKKKISAAHQGVDIKDFEGFMKTKDQRDRYHFAKINKSIFERDNFTCNYCKNSGGTLNAHHLESFAANEKLRFEKSNIITLCKSCHLNFHAKYGRKYNTEKQYIEYKESLCQQKIG